MTNTRTAVERLRAGLEQTVRPLVAGVDRFALIDAPNYPNPGDSAIYLGQLACFRALGLPRPRFVCDFRTYDRAEVAQRLGPSGTIMLTGGGSFGDLWPTAQALREEIVRSFPDNPIIQLPQSIHFERGDALRRARALLNRHPGLTLLVRDRRSLDIARNEFRAPSLLCPDMAFALGPLARPVPVERSVLWLLRTDKEALGDASPIESEARVDWLDEPPMRLRALSYRLIGAWRRKPLRRLARLGLTRLYAPLAQRRLRRGLETLASAQVVITDRLHGHILSLLLGIPHVVLDNSYGKLSSFHDTWMTEVDDVHWAASPAKALAIATDLVGVSRAGAFAVDGPRG